MAAKKYLRNERGEVYFVYRTEGNTYAELDSVKVSSEETAIEEIQATIDRYNNTRRNPADRERSFIGIVLMIAKSSPKKSPKSPREKAEVIVEKKSAETEINEEGGLSSLFG